jgi:hypothetical protein
LWQEMATLGPRYCAVAKRSSLHVASFSI